MTKINKGVNMGIYPRGIDWRRLMVDSLNSINEVLDGTGLHMAVDEERINRFCEDKERSELWEQFKYIAIPRVENN
jgi:ribosomal protein L24E